jgi:hypothetical protein
LLVAGHQTGALAEGRVFMKAVVIGGTGLIGSNSPSFEDAAVPEER